jgi:photosystem II stability/assembly factor-like uncharacterized protein
MNKTYTILILLSLIFSTANSQWIIQHTSVPAQSVYCVRFFNDNTGYHSGVLYNSSTFNIYKTTNGGINYTAQNSHYTAQRYMSVFILHPDTVFFSGNYGKILRTVNGGQNWVTLYSDTTRQLWGLWFVNSQTGFVAGSHGTIMKTTNSGDNWTQLTTSIQNALDGIYFVNENTGYVGGSFIILKTTNAGTTWINMNGIFVSFESANSVYFSDENTGMYSTNAGRIIKTTDGGGTWTQVYSQPNSAVWDLSFPDSQTGYGCTSTGTVIKTINGGTNWIIQNTPLTENLYSIHFPSMLTGYVASWSGKILKTTNGGVTFIGNMINQNPKDFALHQNYPNPFNPSTKISFSIPGRGYVSLKVYNSLGKEINNLVDEQLSRGYFEVEFDGRKLNSGVYFYKLRYTSIDGHHFTDTKKLLLFK